eukprot:166419_1
MSATNVTTQGSLKRKLEDAETDLPSSKRRKLNDQQSIGPLTPFQINQSDTLNTLNEFETKEDQKSEETVQNTNNPSFESTESEQTTKPKPQIRITMKKRFIDSDSEDGDDTSGHIETVAYNIPDVIDKNEEESSDSEHDLETHEDSDDSIVIMGRDTNPTQLQIKNNALHHVAKNVNVSNSTSDVSSDNKQNDGRKMSQTRNAVHHEIGMCIGSHLFIPDGECDVNGNPLESYQLDKVKRIDKEGFVITQSYEEIDVMNRDAEYFMVDTKCKVYKKGQLVASRWPEHATWAQYYVGRILGLHVDENKVWRYNVMFHDGPYIVTKVIPLRMDMPNQPEQPLGASNDVANPLLLTNPLLIIANESVDLLLEAADNVMIHMW